MIKSKYLKDLPLYKNRPTRYVNFMQYTDKEGKPTMPPQKNESRIRFFNRIKLDMSKFEGGSTLEHQNFYDKIIDSSLDVKKVKYVMEIGFNAGASAEYFLKKFPNALVFSFDVLIHGYVRRAKEWIDINFPKRHFLIGGSSIDTIPTFSNHFKDLKFDFIFIDGNHLFDYAFQDMFNCKALGNKETLVMLDNIAPHRGCSREVYYAFRELYDRNEVLFENYYELENYKDAFLTFKYNYDNKKSKELPIEQMERLVRLFQLQDLYQEKKDDKIRKELIDIINNKDINKDIPEKEKLWVSNLVKYYNCFDELIIKNYQIQPKNLIQKLFLLPKSNLFIIWDKNDFNKTLKLIEKDSKIIHQEQFKLTKNQYYNLIFLLYFETDRFKDLNEIRNKFKFIVKNENQDIFDLGIIIYENKFKSNEYKKIIRNELMKDIKTEHGSDLLHNNDSYCKMIEYVKQLVDENSREFLKRKDLINITNNIKKLYLDQLKDDLIEKENKIYSLKNQKLIDKYDDKKLFYLLGIKFYIDI